MSQITLITGIVGSLAQLAAQRLLQQGQEVVGLDYRPKPQPFPEGVRFYQGNYNKRVVEDVFKRHKPTQVLHLGRVGNLKTTPNKRFDLNVLGSAKIMELCLTHDVRRLVVLSTFHIYGAHPHNHIPIFEDEPLRAAQTFPQLADAVQLDNQASTWVYRHRGLKTAVLRPCNVIGPHIQNAVSAYLRQHNQIYLMGFSPMWQFIHELDMVSALLLALKSDHVGIYNIAGGGEIPLVEALEITHSRRFPIPSTLAKMALRATGRITMPDYMLEFLKYPCVISDTKFRKDFDYEAKMGVRDSIRSTVYGSQ